MTFDYASNSADTGRQSGRGDSAAALIASAGVTVLLTGFVGAQAALALAQEGIRVVDGLGALTAREALECLVRGEITPISPIDVAVSPPARQLTKESS
jgi:predicted Fe-Mo cluster-binding NifX family protein